jgi:hypothetical protein
MEVDQLSKLGHWCFLEDGRLGVKPLLGVVRPWPNIAVNGFLKSFLVLGENTVLLFVMGGLCCRHINVGVCIGSLQASLLSFVYITISFTLFDLGAEASLLKR